MKSTTCVILTAGRARRMKPLSTGMSKSMLPFLGRPLLDHTVRALRQDGIRDLVLVVSSLAGDVRSYFSDGSEHDLAIRYHRQMEWPGTAGVVRAVCEQMELSDPFMVVYGDSLLNINFRSLREFHIQTGAVATVAGHRPRLGSFLAEESCSQESPNTTRTNYGVMEVDSEQRVLRFAEKPYLETIRQDFNNPIASAAIYTLNLQAIQEAVLPVEGEYDFGYHLFPSLIDGGWPVYAFDIGAGYRIDIGTPQHSLSAQLAALRGTLPLKPNLTSIRDGVWIATGVVVDATATVKAPAFLDEGVRVGSGSKVSCAILGRNVAIGSNTFIDNSLIFNDVRVGQGSRILHSIVGPECLIGDQVAIPPNSVLGHGCRLGVDELVVSDDEFRSRFGICAGAVVP